MHPEYLLMKLCTARWSIGSRCVFLVENKYDNNKSKRHADMNGLRSINDPTHEDGYRSCQDFNMIIWQWLDPPVATAENSAPGWGRLGFPRPGELMESLSQHQKVEKLHEMRRECSWHCPSKMTVWGLGEISSFVCQLQYLSWFGKLMTEVEAGWNKSLDQLVERVASAMV